MAGGGELIKDGCLRRAKRGGLSLFTGIERAPDRCFVLLSSGTAAGRKRAFELGRTPLFIQLPCSCRIMRSSSELAVFPSLRLSREGSLPV